MNLRYARFSVLALMFLAMFASACATTPSASSNAKREAPVGPPADHGRPNILFIMSDDHATHAISAYGSKIGNTPRIDGLAAAGMRFDNAFVTNSICAPSRAVILTGKHSHKNKQLSNLDVFDGSQVTFPKLMRKADYQTALIGKWHLTSDPTGFDHWEILDHQGSYYNPHFLSPKGREKPTGYVSDIVAEKTVDWLRNKRDPNKPFVLLSQHKGPHANFEPSLTHIRDFEGETIPEPPDLRDNYKGRASPARTQSLGIGRLGPRDLKLLPPPEMNEEQLEEWNKVYLPRNIEAMKTRRYSAERYTWRYQRYIKDYLRAAASIDEAVGTVLDALDELGLAENTVVVYTSDQGFFLGDHGYYDKRFMYEQSLRTPLIVRWPGKIKAGSVNTDLVQNLDFAQTFLALSGQHAPVEMQGLSLVPLLLGNTPDNWRDSIYYHYYEYPGHHVQRHYGVRTDRYKLIHYYQVDEWELFDLQEDPREMNSVYAEPGYAQIRDELAQEIRRLQDQYEVDLENEPEGFHRPVN